MTRKSMTSNLRVAFVLIALFSFHACDLLEEPKPPTWTNTIEFPLVKESVTLESLEDEANISSQLYDSTGTRRIFAYSDTSTMDTQSVGDQLIFDDITQTFSQSVDDVTVTGSTINQSSGFDPVGVDPINENILSTLGPIELSDIPATATDAIVLRDIFPAIEGMIGNVVVPTGDLDTIRTGFTFDDFQSATFVSGNLDLTINNNMVIFLGNDINVQLQEIVAGDTVDIPGASVVWTTPISPNGGSATQTLDLSGKTLPGNIVIKVFGSTIGSDGQQVNIDETAKNSSFTIDVGGSNLVVSEADARVPEQTVDESGNITMVASENKVEEALILEGTLAITVDNQMAVASKLVLTIPSLEDGSGVAFMDSTDLPANTQTPAAFPINGYSMVMDINNQVVEYEYRVKTIDTGNNYVTLAQTDEIDVTIALHGSTSTDQIIFSEITGQIESQSITENGDIDVSSDSKILNADISSGSIIINVDNRINQPGSQGLPKIVLTIPELQDGSSAALTDSLVLQPNPTANTMNIDLSDYSLVFPDTATQVLTYETLVTTPSGETGTFNLADSIIVDIEVSDMEFSSVTGFFSQDAMVDSNEIVLDEGTKLIEAVFETGDLQLTMTNGIGVLADVEFEIDEFKHKITNQSLSTSFALQDMAGPQVTNIDLSDYNLVFAHAVPGQDQAIHYVSRVALPDDQQMTLTFGQAIDIDVNITNLAMESVTGIIEPDTLNIEESQQEIEMPDMVKDLKFERVNIDIDFNSSFDIPIELSLFLSGTNSDDGVTEEIDTTFTLTALNDRITLDAAPLLNIHPDAIVSSGMAVVGDGISSSTIAQGQMMAPLMYINVPLSLIIEDPPFIEMDAEGVDSPLPDDETISLEEVTIFVEAINLFEFGANVVLLASDDSTELDSVRLAQGLADPDTLISFEILPKENAGVTDDLEVNEIVLENGQISIIEDRFFIKPQIQLLGQGSQPARFFTTDSLSMKTWGSVSYTVHGDQLTEEEE